MALGINRLPSRSLSAGQSPLVSGLPQERLPCFLSTHHWVASPRGTLSPAFCDSVPPGLSSPTLALPWPPPASLQAPVLSCQA